MITHDQLERSDPKADLIRFRSLGETLANQPIDLVFIGLNDKRRYEEGYYKGSKVYRIPMLSRRKMLQLFYFSIFLLPVMVRARHDGEFNIIFINSIFSIPSAIIIKWLSRGGFVQFDLMGILSEEMFLRKRKNVWLNACKKAFSSIENILLCRVDFVTTINEKHKEIILKRINKPVYVIRDGVSEVFLRQSPFCKEKEDRNSRLLILFIGQINHFRLDPLLRTLPSLLSELPNLQLQLIGSGPQRTRYVKMVQSLGLENHVVFQGYVSHDRIFDYIEKADIAYTDDWSIIGFPMKIFEYMAMGKAIIAEATDSTQEVLIENVNALLYKNDEELKEKMLILACDEGLRKKLGENAWKMMKQHTWEKRSETLETLYHQWMSR